MNQSTAIFLISDKVRAILAHYDADTPTSKAPRSMFKTMDPAIKVGDFIVVPTNTRHNMTVCKVSDIDVDVDFDSAATVAWVLDRVDLKHSVEIEGLEQQAIKRIQSAEKNRKREEIKKAMLADVGDMKFIELPNTVGGPMVLTVDGKPIVEPTAKE